MKSNFHLIYVFLSTFFCSKELANFHQPKALWYPHDSEMAVRELQKLPTQGPMQIILKSLGGKGSKLFVDSEETISSIMAKASKKLGYQKFSFGYFSLVYPFYLCNVRVVLYDRLFSHFFGTELCHVTHTLFFPSWLDMKPSETVKVFYSGKELEREKSLAAQNVQTNSLLHLVRSKIYIMPSTQNLRGENRPVRSPGAFKKKSDLSVKDEHVLLME